MKTIRRNSTRIIAEIKKSIVSVVFYDQNGGSLKPTTLDAAMDDLYRFDFSKLYDQGNGKYTVHVHSNLWYHLYTQAHLDQAAADQAAREQRAAAHPKPVRPSTREERHARLMASTVSIHDLDKPEADRNVPQRGVPALGLSIDKAPVTVVRTRMAIGDQIAQACEALGIKLGHGWSKGTSCYVVDGKNYTAGELADLVLEGGFEANYGGNKVRVRADSPLRPAERARRALIENLSELYDAEDVAAMSDDEAIREAVSAAVMEG